MGLRRVMENSTLLTDIYGLRFENGTSWTRSKWARHVTAMLIILRHVVHIMPRYDVFD
jgi:hypothetical protein